MARCDRPANQRPGRRDREIPAVDHDTMEWSETIDDPKVYAKPWETMKLQMQLPIPAPMSMEYCCSPVEQENYNRLFGNDVSGK